MNTENLSERQSPEQARHQGEVPGLSHTPNASGNHGEDALINKVFLNLSRVSGDCRCLDGAVAVIKAAAR